MYASNMFLFMPSKKQESLSNRRAVATTTTNMSNQDISMRKVFPLIFKVSLVDRMGAVVILA